MEQFNHIASILALTMGVAWASGINLYAAIFMLGFLGATGNMTLPPGLEILQDPLVLFAAGTMYVVEFFADKIPGVDSGWDALHTFIRIPAGAMLAAGAVGHVDPAVNLAAAILGGTLAAASHATKSGTRLLVNTSPEPFSNWSLSIGEDVAVIAGLWTALHHPLLFIAMMIGFIILLVWLLPRLWQGIKMLFKKIGSLFSGRKDNPASPPATNIAAGQPTGQESSGSQQ